MLSVPVLFLTLTKALMSNTPAMKNSPIPPIPRNLLEWLEANNPPRDDTPHTPLREIDFYNGKRSLITFLRMHYNLQNETLIDGIS
jgi:hypothetical protein